MLSDENIILTSMAWVWVYKSVETTINIGKTESIVLIKNWNIMRRYMLIALGQKLIFLLFGVGELTHFASSTNLTKVFLY